MRLRRLIPVAVLGSLNMFGSCPPVLYTPPIRTVYHEAPAQLGKGYNAISVGAAGHLKVDNWSNYSVATGTTLLSYRRGVLDQLELDFSISYLNCDADGYWMDAELHSLGLRAGYRLAPRVMKKYGSVWQGVGLGVADIGKYVGWDTGIVFGWENRYAVPFTSLGYYCSVPLDSRTLVFESGQTAKAELTHGVQAGMGLKFPYDTQKRAERLRELDVYISGLYTMLYSPSYGYEDVFGFGFSLEFVF